MKGKRKRVWTEDGALDVLRSRGVGVEGKALFVEGNLSGLKACSAFDYLLNHRGYHAIVQQAVN